MAAAGHSDKVKLIHGAVGARSGERLRIYMNRTNSGGHSMYRSIAMRRTPYAEEIYEDVDCLSLDDLFAREGVERCSLLKCDVEGAEYDIFLNASDETLKRIDTLAMEAHIVPPNFSMDRFDTLVARLKESGLSLTYNKPDARSQRPQSTLIFAKRE